MKGGGGQRSSPDRKLGAPTPTPVNVIRKINVLRITLPALGTCPQTTLYYSRKARGNALKEAWISTVPSDFWYFSKIFAGLSRQDHFTGYFLIETSSKSWVISAGNPGAEASRSRPMPKSYPSLFSCS